MFGKTGSIPVVLVVLVALSLSLTACGHPSDGTADSSRKRLTVFKVDARKGMSLQGYASRTDKDTVATITDPADISRFNQAIQDSEKIPGVINISLPTYEIVIQEDGAASSYYLWVDSSRESAFRATYMIKSDTHTAYSISAESTDALQTWVKDALK